MLCFFEELTQILFYLEGLMTHYGKPRVSFCFCDPLSDNQKEWYKVKESTALITFRLS